MTSHKSDVLLTRPGPLLTYKLKEQLPPPPALMVAPNYSILQCFSLPVDGPFIHLDLPKNNSYLEGDFVIKFFG